MGLKIAKRLDGPPFYEKVDADENALLNWDEF